MKRLIGRLWGNGHHGGPKGHGHGVSLPLCIVRHFDRMSSQAESYRSLRTALELVGQSTPFRTLMVTSSSAQEGKTTTLINLAVLFWELGRRVLVVDSDLRRGCLHQVFGVPRSPGLTDLILGKADTLFPAQELKPGFSVMPRGSRYDKPSVLLGSPGLRQALAHFQDRADIVLLDTSPLIPVSDALKLVSAVDGVLVVVRAGQTQRGDAARTRKLLQASRANVLGVVVNATQSRRLLSRDYDQYYYGADHDADGTASYEGARGAVDLDRFA